MSDDNNKQEHHGHHILSDQASLKVLIFLLVFTVLTVVVALFDFGSMNFVIAFAVAAAKATAVMLYFMGLKFDNNENRAVFLGSFAFVAIFIFYTATDLLTRGPERAVTGPVLMADASASAGPQVDNPWEYNEQLFEHGKTLYTAQACQTCHGDEGFGDGPAGMALGARNFHEATGWKNGRSVAMVYKTLSKGLGSMPSYATITPVDRLALAHYILRWSGEPEPSTAEQFAELGIDTAKPDGGLSTGEEEKKTVPIDFAIERYVQEG